MIAIYARQSIDKKDSLSIDGQIDLCIKLAGDNTVIFKDKGFSGKNTNRPAFKELMAAVEEGKIQKVYCYRLDRISRSIADFGRIWETFEKHHVEFQSVTENFDTSTPMGRAMLNIVLVFAQLERETTAERVKDNYIHRFTLGAWTGGPAPYGFDLHKIIGVNGEKSSSLINNPSQSEIVNRIFKEYAETNSSLRSIAQKLTDEKVHGPKRQVWDSVTLSRILHSPVYVKADEDVYWYYISKGLKIQNDISHFDGIHACNIIGRRDRTKNKYNSSDGQMLSVSKHEGFIDSDLWLKVQEKLAGNKQISNANAGKYSWLTGLLKCADCGYSVKINYNKTDSKLYLICSGKSNLKICDTRISISVRELENNIENQLKEIISECSKEQTVNIANENLAEIYDLDCKIERLVTALSESSEISVSYISRQIEKLHNEREKLLAQKKSPKAKTTKINFSNASFEEKKLIAAQFIDKILLKDDTAEIIWKI